MSKKLRVALLCNSKMAMPAMMRIAQAGVLCAVATADKDREVVAMFRQQASQCNVPYLKTSYKNYKEQLAEWLNDAKPDVVFVMTYSWLLPASLLAMPRLGFLNFHYGLLPEMRGADPIFESIRHAMPVAGVTVHMMDEGLDTGPVVLREETPLNADMTYGMLRNQLAMLGDRMCGQILDYCQREWSAVPPSRDDHWCGMALTVQDEANAKYWPRVTMEEIAINWRMMDSAAIKAVLRACNPAAKGAPTVINGWRIGITEVCDVNLQGDTSTIAPGTIVAMDVQNGLIVLCKDGIGLRLEVVYTEEGYLPGYKLAYFGIGQGMIFE